MTLKEFLVELEKTPRNWEEYLDCFRLTHGENVEKVAEYCPITAVCRSMGLGYYAPNFYEDAAKALDLTSTTAKKIVSAADNLTEHSPTLRQQIREKIGL